MKFSIGVIAIVVGYALLYQGVMMMRDYDPSTGDFIGAGRNVAPLGVLLGLTTYTAKEAETDVKNYGQTRPPSMDIKPPFVWKAAPR